MRHICSFSIGRSASLCNARRVLLARSANYRSCTHQRRPGLAEVVKPVHTCGRLFSALSDLQFRSTDLLDETDLLSSNQAHAHTALPTHEVIHEGTEPGTALRVAVLLSGGVDSSLALKLLTDAGHNCKAFYLQIWFQEDFRNFWDTCPWEEDLGYAQKVCESLGVELEVVPLTEQYWRHVVQHCVEEIKLGYTPNPDILCNSRVKFGAFYDHLNTHYADAFDRVASGHYARVVRDQSGGLVRLAQAADAVKDQTYFLAHLTQQQLQRTLFPIGSLTKPQVRQLAASYELAPMQRKDSQGICFLGRVKFHEFVKEHLGEWPGPIVEEETGNLLGLHEGFWFHTVGQRTGLKLTGGPWYVVRKDPTLNVVYASKQYYSDDKVRNAFECGPFNWITDDRPEPEAPLYVKVRHGPASYRAQLTLLPESDFGTVVLEGNDQGLAAGQYAVFYQGNTCLGSARITNCLNFDGKTPHLNI